MLNILKSFLLTSVVSSLGGSVCYFIGFNFIKSFVLLAILQITISYIIRQIQLSVYSIRSQEIELQRITEFSKQGLDVECAYCGSHNFVPLRFDIDNNFTCTNCNKDNSIYISVTTAQVTTPLNISQITSTSFKDHPTITE